MIELPLSGQALGKLEREVVQERLEYREDSAYVEGKNPEILGRSRRKDPDNRIPVPLAKMAVEDLSGYAGRAGDIRVSWNNVRTEESADEESERDEYIELRREIAKHNRSKLLTSELYEEGLAHGVAYELFWVSDALGLPYGLMTPEHAMVPAEELKLVWDDSLKPTLLAAVRFWSEGDEHIADVYYAGYWERWRKTSTAQEYIKEEAPEVEVTMSADNGEVVVGSAPDPNFRTYPFRRVPLAIYPINRKRQPLFEAEKALIDAMDNLLSSSVNEVDRFNALIALFPGKVDKQFVERLVELKVIDELGEYERWPEYLEKSLEKIDGFYNQLADRIERLYHKSVKIPDMTDENFAGNQSGVAIAFKLIGLEFKASSIDTYFDTGLEMRNALINDVLGDTLLEGGAPFAVEDYEMRIEHKRNLPIDEKAAVEIAALLSGLVSKETMLRFLPRTIVEDVEKEMARLEAEESARFVEGVNLEEDEDDAEEETAGSD